MRHQALENLLQSNMPKLNMVKYEISQYSKYKYILIFKSVVFTYCKAGDCTEGLFFQPECGNYPPKTSCTENSFSSLCAATIPPNLLYRVSSMSRAKEYVQCYTHTSEYSANCMTYIVCT